MFHKRNPYHKILKVMGLKSSSAKHVVEEKKDHQDNVLLVRDEKADAKADAGAKCAVVAGLEAQEAQEAQSAATRERIAAATVVAADEELNAQRDGAATRLQATQRGRTCRQRMNKVSREHCISVADARRSFGGGQRYPSTGNHRSVKVSRDPPSAVPSGPTKAAAEAGKSLTLSDHTPDHTSIDTSPATSTASSLTPSPMLFATETVCPPRPNTEDGDAGSAGDEEEEMAPLPASYEKQKKLALPPVPLLPTWHEEQSPLTKKVLMLGNFDPGLASKSAPLPQLMPVPTPAPPPAPVSTGHVEAIASSPQPTGATPPLSCSSPTPKRAPPLVPKLEIPPKPMSVDGDTMDGDRASVDCDRASVDGDRASVDGDRASVDGDYASVDGDRASVDGDIEENEWCAPCDRRLRAHVELMYKPSLFIHLCPQPRCIHVRTHVHTCMMCPCPRCSCDSRATAGYRRTCP